MSDSDFEEEIQHVHAGFPCKQYPFHKQRAAIGELVSSDASDFEEEPEEQQKIEKAAAAAFRRRYGP